MFNHKNIVDTSMRMEAYQGDVLIPILRHPREDEEKSRINIGRAVGSVTNWPKKVGSFTRNSIWPHYIIDMFSSQESLDIIFYNVSIIQ